MALTFLNDSPVRRPAAEDVINLDRPGQRKPRNTYGWSDEFNAILLPDAAPDGFGGSLAFKTHEPFPIKFIGTGRGGEAGTLAEIDRNGRISGRAAADPACDKLVEYYLKPLPEQTFEFSDRPVPTEMEMLAALSAPSTRKGKAMSAGTGKERMVVLFDNGSPVLSITAACVFYSDDRKWLSIGTRTPVDLSALRLGLRGCYGLAVANPATGDNMSMRVINFGISLPNPMGGGFYAVFGIEKEKEQDNGDDQDGTGEGNEEERIEDNASFI